MPFLFTRTFTGTQAERQTRPLYIVLRNVVERTTLVLVFVALLLSCQL